MEILPIIQRLQTYAESWNYAGYDPYDMLNSPLANLLSLGTRFGRIALTQLGRRSPFNFRPLLMVRRGINPKALALFLEGNVRLYRRDGSEENRQRLEACGITVRDRRTAEEGDRMDVVTNYHVEQVLILRRAIRDELGKP